MLQALNAFMATAREHIYAYGGNQFHITVSAGVSLKQTGQTLDSLMRNADKALYQSKDQGRNCTTVL